jgi:hypothetical protein
MKPNKLSAANPWVVICLHGATPGGCHFSYVSFHKNKAEAEIGLARTRNLFPKHNPNDFQIRKFECEE